MCGMLAVAALWMVAIFELESYINHHYPDSLLYYLPIILICVEMVVMNMLYCKVAEYLTNWENYEVWSPKSWRDMAFG